MGEGAVKGSALAALCVLVSACAAGATPERSAAIVPPPAGAPLAIAASQSSADAPVAPDDDGAIEVVEALPIPDRKQDASSPKSGWCGETAIQEGLLHHGMWASQRRIHQAGKSKHPDLYSDEIPVALAGLGVRFVFYAAKTKGFDAYRAWIADALSHDEPVLAGVKILPTEHPDWGLDHFVLVVGQGSKGILVNTTWGSRAWVKDTTTPGLSFKDVYYGIRILGLQLPKGALPARLVVLGETATDVKVKLTCGGITTGAPARVERRKHAGDAQPEWSRTITPASSTIELDLTLDAADVARFDCVQ